MLNRFKSLGARSRRPADEDAAHDGSKPASTPGSASNLSPLSGPVARGASSLRGAGSLLLNTFKSPPKQESEGPGGSGRLSARGHQQQHQQHQQQQPHQREGPGEGGEEGGQRSAERRRSSQMAALASDIPEKVRIASPRTREEVLADLPEDYYQHDFDPLSFELKKLPCDVDEKMLEDRAQEQVLILEVLNEYLSDEVQSRSDAIVHGVNEVAGVEHDLQVAHIVTRNARRTLEFALKEVAANTAIAEKTKQKQMLLETLGVLSKLQGIVALEGRHAEHEDAGDFARAISTCDVCISSLAADPDLCQLDIANELADAACERYRVTMKEMDTALLAVCGDFREDLYSKVLDAYKGLPDHAELAEKVQACFSKVVDTSVGSVVWSYIMQRGPRSDRSSSLTELCRLLPSEIFRPCLSKVLEVVFDILRSHWQMEQWHADRLQTAAAELEVLMARKEAWQEQMQRQLKQGAESLKGEAPEDMEQEEPGASAPAQEAGADSETAAAQAETDEADQAPSAAFPQDEALMEAGARYNVLQVVLLRGLQEGREGVWDAGARCVQQLLNAPGAAEGEHFLQVLEWMHRFITVGESFSNRNAGWLLRDCLARQSGAFFSAFHRQNLDALGMMLEKEPWRPLPGCAIPSLREAVKTAAAEQEAAEMVQRQQAEQEAAATAGGPDGATQHPLSADAAAPQVPFKEWVDGGNPFREWGTAGVRKAKSRKGGSRAPAIQLGFEGSADTSDPRERQAMPLGGDADTGNEEGSGDDEGRDDDSEDEPDELRGDFIDEESQSVHIGSKSLFSTGGVEEASASHRSASDQPTLTLTTLKLLRWMVSYGQLVRMLGGASPHVFKGLCELFDKYLFHIFQTFGNITVAHMADEVHEGGGEEVTPRLRKTLMRIAGYPPDYVPQPSQQRSAAAMPSPGQAAAAYSAAGQKALQGMNNSLRRSSLFKSTRDKITLGGPSAAEGPSGASPHSSPLKPHGQQLPGAMVISSGNMYALKERSVAVESLMAVADELHRARAAIQAVLPPSESQRIDSFYSRTVGAATDLQEHIFHTASLRLLDLSRYPAKIAESKYDISEVGCDPNPWVEQVLNEARQFAEKLTVAGVGAATRNLMWTKALDASAQTLVDGFSRVKRCTLEGRAAMTLDLQTWVRGLHKVLPDGFDPQDNMRIVDTYVKAFYMPEEELVHWAHTHPEYTRPQLVNLITCIADNNKMKRKALKELLAQIETI